MRCEGATAAPRHLRLRSAHTRAGNRSRCSRCESVSTYTHLRSTNPSAPPRPAGSRGTLKAAAVTPDQLPPHSVRSWDTQHAPFCPQASRPTGTLLQSHSGTSTEPRSSAEPCVCLGDTTAIRHFDCHSVTFLETWNHFPPSPFKGEGGKERLQDWFSSVCFHFKGQHGHGEKERKPNSSPPGLPCCSDKPAYCSQSHITPWCGEPVFSLHTQWHELLILSPRHSPGEHRKATATNPGRALSQSSVLNAPQERPGKIRSGIIPLKQTDPARHFPREATH